MVTMLPTIPARTTAALLALLGALLLPVAGRPAGTIEANHRNALAAYGEGDWERAGRLAKVTLQQIESQAWKDWLYQGDRRPLMAHFAGDYIYMATSEAESQHMSQVEIFDPLQDRLVVVKDYKPWFIEGSSHGPNHTATYLVRPEYLGYKIVYFAHGRPEHDRTILRESIETFHCEGKNTTDVLAIFERGPLGWGLCVFDMSTGDFREVHRFKKIDSTKKITPQAKLIQGADHWKFFDGNELYALTVGSWRKQLLYTLPFTVDEYDLFRDTPFERLVAVRGDTLRALRRGPDGRYELRTVRLPLPIDMKQWTDKMDIDESGTWFAQNDADSLRIFRLDGGRGRMVHAASSCIGRTYILYSELIGTFFRGDTLVHYADTGLRIFKGDRPLHRMDAENLYIIPARQRSMLLIFRSPEEFSGLDLRTLRTTWNRSVSIPQMQIITSLKDRHLLFNDIDGMSLLDAETGEELLQIPGVANRAHEVNEAGSKILLGSDHFLGVYEIPNSGMLKADLVAVSAMSKWAAEDTSGALSDARRALSYGMRLSGTLPRDLFNILERLDLRKESLRLAGNMATRSSDELWPERLEREGLEFLVQPEMSEFYAIFKLERGIVAFPALIYPFGVAKGEERPFYWFKDPRHETEMRSLPLCGFSVTTEHIFFFEYRVDASGDNLVWSPVLCSESIDCANLGPLITTPIAADPNRQRYIEYATQSYPTNAFTERRAVTEFFLRSGGIGGSSQEMPILYTAGIDLTGKGRNWFDSTLVHPVRLGTGFYAHRLVGDLIVTIAEGSQADSIGMKTGDVVISFGGYPIANTTRVNYVKTLFPDRHPIDLAVVRGVDTLRFTVLNGRIGYEYLPAYGAVRIDPETGYHIEETRIAPGYSYEGYNSSDELVYSMRDTMLFFDTLERRSRKVTIKGIAEHERFWMLPGRDILMMRRPGIEEIVAVDVSRTADDADRILWKETIENVFQLYGHPRYPVNDLDKELPILLEDGSLLIIDAASGSVVAREITPFQSFGLVPQIWDGVLYGTTAGKIFGWRIARYHPPFPWKYAGFGAAAFVPILLVSLFMNRSRIEKLKRRQSIELKRAEIDAEVSAARRLQAGLIPTGAHDLGAYRLVGKFIPASEVAGDYFDFRLLEDGRLVVVIGDVSGHGLSAGILVSMAKASLMTLNRNGDTDLTRTLESLNEVVRSGAPGKDMFMTICYVVLDPKRMKLRCSANGHPFPLIAQADGRVREIGTNGGYPLGIRDRQEFRIVEVDFRPGETLLVYTDGIPEQLDERGEPWGYGTFVETFRQYAGNRDSESIVDGVLEKVLGHAGEAEMVDDMALVAIRYISD